MWSYGVTVGFGLDAIGCGLLILTARQLLTAGACRWAALLSRLWLLFFGMISYGLYLWQQLFLTAWNTTLSGRLPFCLVVILVCAVISFFWIERPGLRAKQLFARSSL